MENEIQAIFYFPGVVLLFIIFDREVNYIDASSS